MGVSWAQHNAIAFDQLLTKNGMLSTFVNITDPSSSFSNGLAILDSKAYLSPNFTFQLPHKPNFVPKPDPLERMVANGVSAFLGSIFGVYGQTLRQLANGAAGSLGKTVLDGKLQEQVARTPPQSTLPPSRIGTRER